MKMEALGIAASVVGVVGPALHCVRLLIDDIEKISDAPSAIKSLKDDLLAINEALASLQTISDPQWKSLGDAVIAQSKTAMTLCTESCEQFRIAIGRWTRHSDSVNGKLSWRDRADVGFFKQSQIKSTAAQLQSCKATLTSVASIAGLHSSLQLKDVTNEIMAKLSSTEAHVASAIIALDQQLAGLNAKFGTLILAKQERGDQETASDRTSAISQLAVEQTALSGCRQLLEELLSTIQAAAEEAKRGQGRVEIMFGDHNKGSQNAINHGTINNTFSG